MNAAISNTKNWKPLFFALLFAVLPLHVELYRRFFPFFLRFPFFGCFLLPPPPPPSLAIAARAVAALAAPRVCAACSARATTFRSGAPKTCGTTRTPRKLITVQNFYPWCVAPAPTSLVYKTPRLTRVNRSSASPRAERRRGAI